ncbi:MAG: hypothetical protein II370_03965 [Clostridia bacterium]|nr:hypothetical protein [Clostridia bacterium]MBQ5808718.1 hypothetical protein [Clostridia bacterium]
MTEILRENNLNYLVCDGVKAAEIVACDGAEDSFVRINELAFLWKRTTAVPTVHMRMELLTAKKPEFTMIPSISYNGNGWGTTPEYVGDRAEDGTPWTFAWHRATIPSCTFTATSEACVAMMTEVGEDTACSLYLDGDKERHVVIYPEEEQPKTLQRHFWGDAYQGEGHPRTEFTAIILAYPTEDKPIKYDKLLDFAWRYYGHAIDAPRTPENLYDLAISYSRYLYEEEKNGFCGFTMGCQWHVAQHSYMKTVNRYEISWVGQSASMANAMLYHYLKTGDKDALKMGIDVHDSWIKFGTRQDGLIDARLDWDPWRDRYYADDYVPDKWKLGECACESHKVFAGKKFRRDENGQIKIAIDACNIGGAADAYFEGYDLAKQCGIDKPEYLATAFGVCDFAISTQDESGRYAKSWDYDGSILAADGTIGCFLVLPMLTAYKRSGDDKYLDSALKAFNFYYDALERDGFTTAGALDTYCIDKESSSPLLRDALELYDITGDKKYIEAAKNIAWYLCTWLMYYTIEYPKDSLIGSMGYDTFGSTSVSTAHQALDQYALRDVMSFLRLSELTGENHWKEKGIAFFANACQCISDGTMYVNRRVRPAGAQDEAIFHTRWGRFGVPPFSPSQWLPAWPSAFRLEILRFTKDWDILRHGLDKIENAIEHVK